MNRRQLVAAIAAGAAGRAVMRGAERMPPNFGEPYLRGPFVHLISGFQGSADQGCQYVRSLHVYICPAQELVEGGPGPVLLKQPELETVMLGATIITVPEPGERPYWETGEQWWLTHDIEGTK